MRRRTLLPTILVYGFIAAHAFALQNVAEQYLFLAANQERASRGIPLLRLDPALSRAATRHALQMAAHRNISHQFGGERGLSERGSFAGARFSRIAENVAEGPSALVVHDAWMQSPGHRANLLDPNVDAVGVAVVVRSLQMYAVQDFAQLTKALSLGEQEAAVAVILDKVGISLLPDTARARSACMGVSTIGMNAQSGLRPAFILRYTTSSIDRLPKNLLQDLATGEFHNAAVGACTNAESTPFAAYRLAVLLYR